MQSKKKGFFLLNVNMQSKKKGFFLLNVNVVKKSGCRFTVDLLASFARPRALRRLVVSPHVHHPWRFA
jgi:hypothetical protein